MLTFYVQNLDFDKLLQMLDFNFQIVSNDEYKSVKHRVLAIPQQDARILIAIFLNPSKMEDLYGSPPELISPEKPALFRQFTLTEFVQSFFSKELDGESLINFFSL
ncbi:hypothetical protein NE237_020553 [Protea cynaroides]|uniref:Isopenicillin N synthase-like Fe(2+) 2OG dioxygenase domain-containing protein n=1 Tax=Protea cynaroides TaxID=273540 RepID=A0A9Q0H6V4_9MAGN|nr:hypothetical protein NE237_020553 [Protea cynaroides]